MSALGFHTGIHIHSSSVRGGEETGATAAGKAAEVVVSAAKGEVGAASGATERATATATIAGAKMRTGKATVYHHLEKKCAADAI